MKIFNLKTIAVIGCSRDPNKMAHVVPAYLQQHGYTIIPINPSAEKILDQKVYLSLDKLPEQLAKKVDIVLIFRPTEVVEPFVKQAIAFKKNHQKLKVVWLQDGIVLQNQKVEEEVKKAGLHLEQNNCMMREHSKRFEAS